MTLFATPGGHGLGYAPSSRNDGLRAALEVLSPEAGVLPPYVDLRPNFFPTIADQGSLGSCTGNASAALFEYTLKKEGVRVDHNKSRLFNYYFARLREGTQATDSGADPLDNFASLVSEGLPDETWWPYDITQFAVEPNAAARKAANNRHALKWYKVNLTALDFKNALAAGYGISLAISVYDSFEGQDASATGVIPMPQASESLLGGHNIVVAGYADIASNDLLASYFLCRNSWGPDWGHNGYFFLPYDYLTGSLNGQALTMEALALELVTATPPK